MPDRIADRDLAALDAELEPQVVDVELLRVLPSRGRYCYRLRLADGSLTKARQLGSKWRAENLGGLCGFLDERHVLRVLAGRGALSFSNGWRADPWIPSLLLFSQAEIDYELVPRPSGNVSTARIRPDEVLARSVLVDDLPSLLSS